MQNIANTCPDPCRKPDTCVTEKNVVKGSCSKVQDKDRVAKLMSGDYKSIFGPIYAFTSECKCKQGYIWNPKTKYCDFLRAGCSLKR